MIEHTVNHDPHFHRMGSLHKLLEVFVRPECRVNMKVINQVILMILSGHKDGIHVDTVEAK